MNREKKSKEVEQLQADLSKAGSVFVVNFTKIPVSADWELRRQVRAAGGRYRVVKNTLAEGTRLEIIETAGQAWCLACGKAVPIRQRYDPCPLCDGYQVQPTGGMEMKVKELEVE